METKTCTKCKLDKNMSDFSIHRRTKGSKSYVKSRCKMCLREDNKEYYNENVDVINKPIICECGLAVCKQNLKRHCKTKLHLKLLESKN